MSSWIQDEMMTEGNWVQAKISLLKRTNIHISRLALHLYLILLGYAKDKNTCYPSIKLLAKDLKCSTKSINRKKAELKKFGLIDWEQEYWKPGDRWKHNVYTLLKYKPIKKTEGQTKKNNKRLRDTSVLLIEGHNDPTNNIRGDDLTSSPLEKVDNILNGMNRAKTACLKRWIQVCPEKKEIERLVSCDPYSEFRNKNYLDLLCQFEKHYKEEQNGPILQNTA